MLYPNLISTLRYFTQLENAVTFCLFVYFFIRSVTHVTLDTSITDYNLYIAT